MKLPDLKNWLNYFEDKDGAVNNWNEHFSFVLTVEEQIMGCGGFAYTSEKNEAFMAWGWFVSIIRGKGLGKNYFNTGLGKLRIYTQKQALFWIQHNILINFLKNLIL